MLLKQLKKGEIVEVNVNIGEEIAHPNTFEHYISWIKVYFHPEGGNFPIEIGTYDFAAHGEYDVFTEPNVTLKFKAENQEQYLLQAIAISTVYGKTNKN